MPTRVIPNDDGTFTIHLKDCQGCGECPDCLRNLQTMSKLFSGQSFLVMQNSKGEFYSDCPGFSTKQDIEKPEDFDEWSAAAKVVSEQQKASIDLQLGYCEHAVKINEMIGKDYFAED